MTSSQLVSVIITCHNQQQCIEQAIGSVTAQSHREIECLVVDDGSTDESASVIRRFAANDERIRLIATPNCGVTAARNTGFREAKGAFIQFLDGDDTLEPAKLERQLQHFDQNATVDVSFTNHRHYFVQQKQFRTFAFTPIAAHPLKQFLTSWHSGVSLPVHAPLYRRSIWNQDELPYPEDYHSRCEDWVFLVLVAAKGVRFDYLDQVLCTYFFYGKSFTSDITDSCSAAILAAQYLESRIPKEHRAGFVADVIKRNLNRFHDSLKADVLYASKNWQLGNLLTKPFFLVAKALKRMGVRR
jgi:glycosyltransferase involved in cell wall biosynthesis